MKQILFVLLLSYSGLSAAHAEMSLKMTALAAAPTSDTETFFKISNGEALIGAEVIREFAINQDRVTVAYKNTTKKRVSPKFTLRIYNRYGVLLGSDEVSPGILGGSPHLEPGDIGGDQLRLEWTEVTALFKHSTVGDLPEDFLQAKWLSISKSNSKVGPKESDQPATAPEVKPEEN